MELPHLFNLIEIYDEAGFLVVKIFDTLSTKYRRMLTTIEMLDSLVVQFAKIGFKFPRIGFVFFIQVYVSL